MGYKKSIYNYQVAWIAKKLRCHDQRFPTLPPQIQTPFKNIKLILCTDYSPQSQHSAAQQNLSSSPHIYFMELKNMLMFPMLPFPTLSYVCTVHWNTVFHRNDCWKHFQQMVHVWNIELQQIANFKLNILTCIQWVHVRIERVSIFCLLSGNNHL